MSSRTAPRPVSQQSSSRSEKPEIRIGWAALLYFGLSILYFIPAFLPGRQIFGTDYLAGGFFFNEFVSERLAAGALPKWVPYIYGGLPLSANPGSTFFPVRLLADLIFPVTWILPLIFVAQFGLAGVGMYLLARELGCRSWIALIAGLAFEFTGITMSSVYAGHDGRVIVATLAPLFLFFLHRGIRTGAIGAFVGAAATLGFSLLSFQIQSNYYLLLAGMIWAVFSLVHLKVVHDRGALSRRVALGLAAVAFGFVLAAVNFLPFLDYVPESPRGGEGGRGYDYSVSWSMPPGELLSIAVPEHAGILEHYQGANPFKLHTEYLGALVIVLLGVGIGVSRRNCYWWLFGGLALFTLSIAFGGHTPLYRLYYELLPGTTRFRAPSISFFLFALSLVAMAAITLEILARMRDGPGEAQVTGAKGRKEAFQLGRWLAAITAIALLGALFSAAGAGGTPRDAAMVSGFGRFALFTAAIAGLLWLWWSERLRTGAFVAVVALVTLIDLWIVDRKFFETVPGPETLFAADDVVSFLRSQGSTDRVWVLPLPAGAVYQGGGNYLMHFGIDQAGGEHGNQLQRFNEYVGAGEEVYVDWSNFLEEPNFLRAANIRFIVSLMELETPLFREVHRGSALVYENPTALPRAYLVEEVITTSDSTGALTAFRTAGFDPARTAVVYDETPLEVPESPLQGTATIVEEDPDRVVVRTIASRPAFLVLADNYFAGWHASIGGEEIPIRRTNHTFRGVPVPAGESEVIFEYRPADLYLGFYIYLAGFGLLGLYGVIWLVRARSRRDLAPAE